MTVRREQDRILGLIRFADHKRIEEFVNTGLLFMNTLEHFKEQEANQQRLDKEEGVNWCMQPAHTSLSVKIHGVFHEIPGIVGPILHQNPKDWQTNIFCMYAVRPGNMKPLIDPRNFGFGNAYAILTDGDEFLRRVQLAAMNADLQIDWRRVTYVDRSKHHGPMGIFCKFAEFSHQNEFRIAIFPSSGKPYRLEVSDLSDIAIIGSTNEVNERLIVNNGRLMIRH
jgi:hypothetical protein